MPRCWGVTRRHSPSNAFRAAATAMSTSFSVASCTEQMTSSVDGLMTSNVFFSTPSTNSLLMKLAAAG
jgi:hypothetical protein